MEVNGYQIESGADLSAVKIKRIAASLVLVFVFLAGCSSSGSNSTTTTVTGVATTVVSTFQLSELKSAEDRWRKSNNSEYQFTIDYYCWFCRLGRGAGGPFRVTVKDKQVTSISPIRMQDPASNQESQRPGVEIQDGESAEDLFKRIRRSVGAFDFSAIYDKKTGVPLNFYSGGDEFVIDDEFGFQTSEFSSTQR
jgi:hypothetical protein